MEGFGVTERNESEQNAILQSTYIISTFFGKLVLLLEAILSFPFLANFFFCFREIQGQYASANEMDGVKRKEAAIKASEAAPKPFGGPKMEMPLEDRVDAMLQFYENCDNQRFAAAEAKYKKLINSPDLTEAQYERMVEAHDKRKVELMV